MFGSLSRIMYHAREPNETQHQFLQRMTAMLQDFYLQHPNQKAFTDYHKREYASLVRLGSPSNRFRTDNRDCSS